MSVQCHEAPCLALPTAAAKGVIAKVAFGWSTSKSYYLLIGFVLALFCPIANCLSRIRSTMRCLSAVLWAFGVKDLLSLCLHWGALLWESFSVEGRKQGLRMSGTAVGHSPWAARWEGLGLGRRGAPGNPHLSWPDPTHPKFSTSWCMSYTRVFLCLNTFVCSYPLFLLLSLSII